MFLAIIIVCFVLFVYAMASLYGWMMGYPENFVEVNNKTFYLKDKFGKCNYVMEFFHNVSSSSSVGNPKLYFKNDKCCYIEERRWNNETQTYSEFQVCEDMDLIEGMTKVMLVNNYEKYGIKYKE